MGKRIKIRTKRPWIAYPGSTIQQSYAEDLDHGYLLWDIKSAESYDVGFQRLSNPKPFVTINWLGTVEKTLVQIQETKRGSRIRVKSQERITQKDIQELTVRLVSDISASEVTFKIDVAVDSTNLISAGDSQLVRDDLRNPAVLMKLIKDYYVNIDVSEEELQQIQDKLGTYIESVNSTSSPRNIVWSLKNFKFDNLFSYGKGNIIDFEKLNGIVGIFGPNRSGKSSLPGSIMYTMFNATDRGSIKNKDVCNIREPYCYGRCIVNISGTDYVIERQTSKSETKKGVINSSTALNLFRVDENDEIVDLAGEGRIDTEKELRNLVGTSSDFLVTTFAAQGEMNKFIDNGSSKRWTLISRFLDLDIFKQLYDLAKQDVNLTKALLKKLPDRDWEQDRIDLLERLKNTDQQFEDIKNKLVDLKNRVHTLRSSLNDHDDIIVVSETQIAQQRLMCESLERKIDSTQKTIQQLTLEISADSQRVNDIDDLVSKYDIDELRQQSDALNKLRDNLVSITHSYETESSKLKSQKKSLKILEQVPCDDKFPECRFIKDAHINKGKIEAQNEKVESVKSKVEKITTSLNEVLKLESDSKLNKVELLSKKSSELKLKISTNELTLSRLNTERSKLESDILSARDTLSSLEQSISTDENIEVIKLKTEISNIDAEILSLDHKKTSLATEKGRIESMITSLDSNHELFKSTIQDLRIFELISYALSKKGVPNLIVSSQLPLINLEIAKILGGIVDFTIELETDDDSEDIQVYINYGDSRRIIELGSGMEKMLSSIALRVALINVSTLPKTDMLMIDEGFGALDESGIEAISRLLESLKRYYRLIMIITHIDSVKDIADHILEITKHEKNSRMVFE